MMRKRIWSENNPLSDADALNAKKGVIEMSEIEHENAFKFRVENP